jgi:hypothetical protein
MSLEETPRVISADILRTVTNDLGQYQETLVQHNAELHKAVPEIREKLLAEGAIHSLTVSDHPLPMGAVDASRVLDHRAGFGMILALGIAYTPPDFHHTFERIIGHDDETFSRIGGAVLTALECELLSPAAMLTIADNSYWSFLYNVNKLASLHHGLSNGPMRELAAQLLDRITGSGRALLRMLANPHVIAMSKTTSGNAIARRHRIETPVSDRALMSVMLKPGEYLTPRPLVKYTAGHFGISHHLPDWQEIQSYYADDGKLSVLFFRPWLFQRAYRVELHTTIAQERSRLEAVLSAIMAATQYPTISEPYPQFLVDDLTKDIAGIARLYGDLSLQVPSVGGATRTE